jgi:hypothetical protein
MRPMPSSPLISSEDEIIDEDDPVDGHISTYSSDEDDNGRQRATADVQERTRVSETPPPEKRTQVTETPPSSSSELLDSSLEIRRNATQEFSVSEGSLNHSQEMDVSQTPSGSSDLVPDSPLSTSILEDPEGEIVEKLKQHLGVTELKGFVEMSEQEKVEVGKKVKSILEQVSGGAMVQLVETIISRSNTEKLAILKGFNISLSTNPVSSTYSIKSEIKTELSSQTDSEFDLAEQLDLADRDRRTGDLTQLREGNDEKTQSSESVIGASPLRMAESNDPVRSSNHSEGTGHLYKTKFAVLKEERARNCGDERENTASQGFNAWPRIKIKNTPPPLLKATPKRDFNGVSQDGYEPTYPVRSGGTPSSPEEGEPLKKAPK